MMKNLQRAADILVKNNILIFYGMVKDRILRPDRENRDYSFINIKNGIMSAQNCITGVWERIRGVVFKGGKRDNAFIPLLAHTVRPYSKEGSDRAVDLIYAATENAVFLFAP